MRRTPIALVFALALASTGLAQAATATLYNNLAAWQAAVAGSAQLQDFSSFNTGDDLTGVAVLPGLTLSSNMGGNMHVFGANNVAAAFGAARQTGTGYYEGNYTLPFLAAAMDITSFEADPNNATTAQDTGTMTFWFSDGTSQNLAIAGNLTGDNIFVGIVSDSAITSFRWTEAHEASGGNEETALDNFRVAMRDVPGNTVPLPGTLPLALLAMGVLPMVRRRRG